MVHVKPDNRITLNSCLGMLFLVQQLEVSCLCKPLLTLAAPKCHRHVKGVLLYGPPGTGKTLIARQLGKMLNGKEPKVVNGPEVLNKFVGGLESTSGALHGLHVALPLRHVNVSGRHSCSCTLKATLTECRRE